MLDPFLILTPVLLLAIVALLGFVGCYQPVALSAPVVMHVQTVVNSAPFGTKSITAGPLTLQGGELIIATLQWRTVSVQPAPAVTLTAGSSMLALAPVPGGGPFDWNTMIVQSFFVFNPQGNTSVSVQAVLTIGSNIQWNLCASAYENVDLQVPVYNPEPEQNYPAPYFGTNPQTSAINIGSPGDLVYAVAFAATNNGTFPGGTSIAAGPNFTAESGNVKNPLVEDLPQPNTNSVVAEATVSGDANPRAFIFAMGLKSAA
jgi:hypothetical protein